MSPGGPPIYLDHNATTPVRSEVWSAMSSYLRGPQGNPSSLHWAGRQARAALEEAREAVATFLGAHPHEIRFTSGGTEANNLAILGYARAQRQRGHHLITTAVEHSSVLACVRALEREGFAVTVLPVGSLGEVTPESVREAIRPDTILASVGWANNEIGTIQPVAAIASVLRAAGVALHADAVAAAGKIPLDVGRAGVDLASISAHKFSGPPGVGALYVRRPIRLEAVLHGGPQESELRPGTENLPGIVGLGAACRLAGLEIPELTAQLSVLRERLLHGLTERITGLRVNGPITGGLITTLNVGVDGVDGESLLIRCDLAGIAVSSGSACAAGAPEPSHVLLALGRSPQEARGALRFGLGRTTSAADVDAVLARLPAIVEALRSGPDVRERQASTAGGTAWARTP